MNKRTKIIATIGPASASREMIYKLIEEGVNLFRFNLKHNSHKWHQEKINLVRNISEDLSKKIGIIGDLQGPDIRIGNLSKEELILTPGKEVYFEESITEEESIELDSKFLKALNVKQEIVIDDGNHRLIVTEKINDKKIKAKVEIGKTLTSKKGVFFPDLEINLPVLSEKDLKDIRLLSKLNAEYAALSFVRGKKDIEDLQKIIKKYKSNTKVIAKIETLKAVKNIDEILEVSDALMIARGDLGVEMYLEAVPALQRKLIEKGIKSGKPVIVATQMLKSMIDSPTPTRAEISDVANASFDKADAVMLSEETAIGKYPDKAVHFMARTLKYNEMLNPLNTNIALITKTQSEAVVLAADNLQQNLKKTGQSPKAFIVLTESGKTARLLSATRPELPIIAFTPKEFVSRALSLSWGVESHTTIFKGTIDESVREILKKLVLDRTIEKGDSVIIISGQNVGVTGRTDSLRILEV